jgi:hypothetical protein
LSKNGSSEQVPGFPFVQDISKIPNVTASQVTFEQILPLKNLVPGQYTLKLKITDQNRNQVLTPSAQFTVN